MWAKVFRDHARQKLCYPHIAGRDIADWAPADSQDILRAEAAEQIAIDTGLVPEPYDGDGKSERRLATLLWRWTCPKVDWHALVHCNESADNIGTQMWAIIMNRYQLRASTEVGGPRRVLQRKQEH